MKNIIHKQYNHIGKRNKWALKYARKIAEALEITGALKIARITAIISEAGTTYPPECIEDNAMFYSPRFDDYYRIERNRFTDGIKELEKSGNGYYDIAEDIIVIHRPNAERKALEFINRIAPGKSTNAHNDIIYIYLRYEDKDGNKKRFNKRQISRVRSEPELTPKKNKI